MRYKYFQLPLLMFSFWYLQNFKYKISTIHSAYGWLDQFVEPKGKCCHTKYLGLSVFPYNSTWAKKMMCLEFIGNIEEKYMPLLCSL
jgi:hypothetical protein